MNATSKLWTSVLAFALVVGCAADGGTRGTVGAPPESGVIDQTHGGPQVVLGPEGPARFARTVYEAFDTERAMDTVRFLDRFFRAPASEGYDASLDYIRAQLELSGFGANPRLELREIVQEMDYPAWTPRRARLVMYEGEKEIFLHGFEDVSKRDRCMLPANSPSCKLEGDVVFRMHQVEEGKILVTEAFLRDDILRRAAKEGAVAVFSKHLFPFNVDPTGGKRHLDAIQYRGSLQDLPLPVAQISPRAYERLAELYVRDGSVHVKFEAEVATEERPLRTLVAAIRGRDREREAVAFAAHLQEPGACDNASGTAGLLENARMLARLLDDGDLDWPSRTLVFIWGEEMAQSSAWIEETERTPVAGISADMIGQSRERTGAIALLERMPDPGAVVVLPPDVHTPWGANEVDPEELLPNGLNVIGRCAIVDVNAVSGGDWVTREHPWEGGSDHDEFIKRGIPGLLFWHFTDFAYHTSLDRIDNVDPLALRRMSVALLLTGLCVADPREADLDRYLKCVKQEEDLRVSVALENREEELAQMWRDWCRGARSWLRAECLRLAVPGETPGRDEDR